MKGKTMVILGGGVGGIVAANELRNNLPQEHKIIIIEKNVEHAFAPSFIWLMTGDRTFEKIVVPVQSLIRHGIDFLHAEVTGIDTSARRITTSAQPVDYDYLVLAAGAELAPELVPGLEENAHSFYTIEGAKKLQSALSMFNGGDADFKNSRQHKVWGGAISIVVCTLPYKCPGAPHEAAMLIADHFQKRGLMDKVRIHLYTPEPQPMPVAGPKLGEALVQMLASRNIDFHPLHKLVSINTQSRELLFDGNKTGRYDMLIAIPPHRAPRVIRDAGLLNEAGWVPVDRRTLKTKYESVYAIGDITSLSIPGRWKPDVPMVLPKAGVFAHAQGEIVARRIADEINGNPAKDEFNGIGYCMIEAGGGKAGFASGDFFAETAPKLELRKISRIWHLGKVIFERWWLASFGVKKYFLSRMMNLGAKILKIPMNV